MGFSDAQLAQQAPFQVELLEVVNLNASTIHGDRHETSRKVAALRFPDGFACLDFGIGAGEGLIVSFIWLLSVASSITEAEGLAELGLWQDAWEALEELQTPDRALPHALRVRLACCPSLGAWEVGRHIADLLRDGSEADRQAAAQYFHAVDLKWLAEGYCYAAGQAIKEAVKTWRDHRLAVLDDPRFAAANLF